LLDCNKYIYQLYLAIAAFAEHLEQIKVAGTNPDIGRIYRCLTEFNRFDSRILTENIDNL
jgi:hypothetical protein